MSFILDALKKSDNKRQEDSVPDLQSVHAATPAKSSRKLFWALILVVLGINAGLLLWFFAPWQEQTNTEVVSTSRGEEVQVVVPRAAAPAAGSSAVLTTPQRQTFAGTAESSVAREVQPLPTVQVRKKPAKKPQISTRSRVKVSSITAIPDLPTSIQHRIAKLHMSVHAYDPENAMASLVRINNRILRAGDMSSNNFLLEEIVMEGAVFSYQGYRFLLARRGN